MTSGSNILQFRWRRLSEGSINHQIFNAAVAIGTLTIMVHLVAMAKEMLVAAWFGTDDALDALLIALLLPSFAINVVVGSYNSAIIPTFIRVRENEGPQAAQQLFSSFMIWGTGLLIAISVLLAMTASFFVPVIGSGFSPEKQTLTRSLCFVLIPILVISGFGMTWAAILNANERFVLAAMSPMLKPIVTIILLLTMSKIWGIYALAIGIVAGGLLEAGLLAWGLRGKEFYLFPRWYGMNNDMKKVINQYIPMVAGAFLMSSTSLIDQSMAAMLGPGSVSTLNYASKIVATILGIGSISLGTALFPHLSRMVSLEDWNGVRNTLKTYAQLISFISIPLTLAVIYFSEPLVFLFFERGAFTSTNTHLVSRVQAFYAIQSPFYMLGILMVRMISSLQANHVLMWGAVINLSLNVFLNYVFMQWWGVAGIALSTSTVYFISFCYLGYKLSHLLRKVTHEKR